MSLREPKQITATAILYPESDGEPMAETDVHIQLMIDLRFTLREFFRDAPDVYVGSNLMLYFVQGNPRKCIAPDVFVARGVGNHRRRTFKLWEEKHAPEVVFEISSRQTWGDDLQGKWQLYQQLGVREYFIFDPEYDYLFEPLVAYRLEENQYVQLEIVDRRVRSEALGLELVDTGETLRLFNPLTRHFLPTTTEATDARRRTEEALQAEADARRRAEAAQLRLEVERLRAMPNGD